jgi:hypothetical protein
MRYTLLITGRIDTFPGKSIQHNNNGGALGSGVYYTVRVGAIEKDEGKPPSIVTNKGTYLV